MANMVILEGFYRPSLTATEVPLLLLKIWSLVLRPLLITLKCVLPCVNATCTLLIAHHHVQLRTIVHPHIYF